MISDEKVKKDYRKDLGVDVFALRSEGDDKATSHRRLPDQKHPEHENNHQKGEEESKVETVSFHSASAHILMSLCIC